MAVKRGGIGFTNAAYAYDSERPHAVTSVDRGTATDTYAYDGNGNMTCRVEDGNTYLQFYNAENRFSVAWLVTGTCAEPGTTLAAWTFTYDGDGTRVRQVYTDGSGTLTTYYFFGGAYEVRTDGSTTETLKYYSFGGQTILRDADGLKYMLTDHLGSVAAITDASGTLLSQTRYLPFGPVRDDVGSITQTDWGYTGQRDLDAQNNAYLLGLMDYKARFYDGALMKFIQPDTIMPGAANPQAWNRYAYVLNRPTISADPSGHMRCNVTVKGSAPVDEDACLGAQRNPNIDYVDPLDYQKPGLPVHVHRTVAESPAPPKAVDILYGAATVTQDIATAIDYVFSVVELFLIGAGCVDGGPAGCVAGATAGRVIFNSGPNAAESTLSGVSLALTFAADLLDDQKLGEATSTSFVTFVTGAMMPDPIGDLAIDGYASLYNHGVLNGIDTIMKGGPLIKK